MLHARFVVHDYRRVVARQVIQRFAQQVIDGAVAAWTFRPAHGDQIEAFGLGDGALDLVFDRADAANAALRRSFGAGALFADFGQRMAHVHAEGLGQIRVGIGVDGQDRRISRLSQGPNQQRRERRLSDPPFAGNCNGKCHGQSLLHHTGRLDGFVAVQGSSDAALRFHATDGKRARSVCGRKQAEVNCSM